MPYATLKRVLRGYFKVRIVAPQNGVIVEVPNGRHTRYAVDWRRIRSSERFGRVRKSGAKKDIFLDVGATLLVSCIAHIPRVVGDLLSRTICHFLCL